MYVRYLFEKLCYRHEVRNPLAASLSACTFVSSELRGSGQVSEQSRKIITEDVEVIDNSLRFINDLLRSMLDCHRAASNQLVICEETIDILKDIFEPIKSLIYTRDARFEVLLGCQEGLVVTADRLRLQQVVLNLTRNSAKFVEGKCYLWRLDPLISS